MYMYVGDVCRQSGFARLPGQRGQSTSAASGVKPNAAAIDIQSMRYMYVCVWVCVEELIMII